MEFTSKRLDKLCDIIIGRTPSRSNKAYWGKGGTWVSISDLKSKYITETKEEITKLGIEKSRSKLISKGTLLLSFKLSIGKLAFAGKDLYTNEAIVALPILDSTVIDKDYLYYALRHIPLIGGNQAAMGKTLNKKSLSALEIPYPKSLSDQKRIAKVLSDCEQLIAWRKESIQLLDEYLESVFLEMFGDRTKFGKEKIKEIAADSKYSISSGPFGSSLTSKHYVDQGVLVLRGKNVAKGNLNLSDSKFVSEEKAESLKRSAIYPDDIVIVAVGSSGMAYKIPPDFPNAIMSQNFNKITCDKNKVIPTFLEYMINSEIVQSEFRKVMVDAGRSFLSLTNIKNIEVPIPEIKDQLEFENIVNKIDSIKLDLNNSLNDLQSLYGSVFQKAFKGELDLSKVVVDEEVELVQSSEETTKVSTEKEEPPRLKKAATKGKGKRDIRNMYLLDYFGIPEELYNKNSDAHFAPELDFIFDDLFYQFYLKDNFADESFTFLELHQKFNSYYIPKGQDFEPRKWKAILYKFMERKKPLVEQIFEEKTGTIKLKLTDEAFKA